MAGCFHLKKVDEKVIYQTERDKTDMKSEKDANTTLQTKGLWHLSNAELYFLISAI